MKVDHVPQLVVEGVALAPRRAISYINVEAPTGQVGHVAPTLAVVAELLAEDIPAQPHAIQEAPRVQAVLRRERGGRARERAGQGRGATDACARFGVALFCRPAKMRLAKGGAQARES